MASAPNGKPNFHDLLVQMSAHAARLEVKAAMIQAATERLNQQNWATMPSWGLGPDFLEELLPGLGALYETRNPPSQARPCPSLRVARRDLMSSFFPKGGQFDPIAWLPKDTSMFPPFQNDKVYMNGKVYCQGYGRILFELPHEKYCPPKTLHWEVGPLEPWATTSDGGVAKRRTYVETYDDDNAAPDSDFTYADRRLGKRARYE
ncbi:hypothetical protein RhiJN_20732 [Ceratobasidium sp. AG-Ba]|nr:hypothetical protein RhiJN_20732 [Ceratobasidium sp. AG-Ba]